MSKSDRPDILIFGAGGHAKAVIETIQAAGLYTIAGLIDDRVTAGTTILGYLVLGASDLLPALFKQGIRYAANSVGGIGNVDSRIHSFELLSNIGFELPSLIHPSAVVETSALIGGGVHIMPLSYIGSESRLGAGTLVNAGCCVSHDCLIGKVVNLSPHATLAGDVVLEDYVQVGMSATINLGLTVGARARIGNSAVVKADVPAGAVVWAGTIWPPRHAQELKHVS